MNCHSRGPDVNKTARPFQGKLRAGFNYYANSGFEVDLQTCLEDVVRTNFLILFGSDDQRLRTTNLLDPTTNYMQVAVPPE